MVLLELFAGSRSVGKVAEKYGFDVISLDWEPYEGIELVMDIRDLEVSSLRAIPDVIWASPDCKTYSIAACSTHRDGIKPKTDYAVLCDEANTHMINLINEILKVNPDCTFFIENPRGMMRKMPFMQGFDRHTIWYCQYGDIRAKPTDIWTNSKDWTPRPQCFNGNKNCHHTPAPRGSKTGTQGLKGSYERSKIPEELCKEVIESTIK